MASRSSHDPQPVDVIDLRSDTVTKPSKAMREAMARAPVGDDVYGDDPTVGCLESRVAEVLGKEEAVYVPTGTMANQAAIRAHTQSGDRVLLDWGTHSVRSESGGPAALSGVTADRILGKRGVFTAAQLVATAGKARGGRPDFCTPPATLLCVENTHNAGGGKVWPLDALDEVARTGRSLGLRTHLDGARLWNASAATGVSEARWAREFDSVSVCFSKGLGAPLGSAVAGSRDFVQRVRRFKQLFGGGFRQAGIVAAGALHALERHRDGLPLDHKKAQALAGELASLPAVNLRPESVETNIVRFEVATSAANFVEACRREGVVMLDTGPRQVRAVTHRDVSMDEIGRAAEVMAHSLEGLQR